MTKSLEGDERFNGVTISYMTSSEDDCLGQKHTVNLSGYSLEVATGRRPPDLFDVETANPERLSANPPEQDLSTLALQGLALQGSQHI